MITFLLVALIAAPRAPRARPAPDQPVQEQLSDAELRERVDAYLGAIERPAGAARWKALGPQAAPILEAVIADEGQFPSRRAKAVDGLVAAAPDRAAAIVGKLARDERQPPVVRIAAMHGAGQVLPPAKAVSELRPVLRTAKTTGMRAQAAEVLARKQGGCAEVRDQVAREQADRRDAFARAMKQCRE
ncbi:MAG TPA: hypothetical protein VE755_05440 [Myxococcales bacterium]|nr:hypothetical protein [Myxococcales bacterium]